MLGSRGDRLRSEQALSTDPFRSPSVAKVRRAEIQYLVPVTRQRLATLLRLEVSVSRSGFWVAMIQHVADQVDAQ